MSVIRKVKMVTCDDCAVTIQGERISLKFGNRVATPIDLCFPCAIKVFRNLHDTLGKPAN